jgi:signal transduction histidine kinase
VAGEIAAMVAHEVRNPLTGVRSLAQRMGEDTLTDERRRRYAAVIVREVDRVEQMVGALLRTSRRTAGRTEERAALGELFDDVGLLVSGRFRAAGVHLVLEPPAPGVATARRPMAQVLLNLLLNAVAQAPPQSTVRVCARLVDDARVEVAVEDRGPGVPAGEREAIFAPFHSATGGSGLGLAVARRLCEDEGWEICVEETPGATFVVTVPDAPRSADAGAAEGGTVRGARAEAQPA